MPQIKLLAGLGNPGEAYRHTRHNIGFQVLDAVSESLHVSFQHENDADIGCGTANSRDILLVKPLTFMNLSGFSVSRIANRNRILSEEILVIHDDIDLAFGRIKIKEKGGHGGHRGIQSITEVLGGGDFARLRIGIGRPETGDSVTNHVLGKFNEHEAQMLSMIISEARDAVVAILAKGVKDCMNVFNQKQRSMNQN